MPQFKASKLFKQSQRPPNSAPGSFDPSLGHEGARSASVQAASTAFAQGTSTQSDRALSSQPRSRPSEFVSQSNKGSGTHVAPSANPPYRPNDHINAKYDSSHGVEQGTLAAFDYGTVALARQNETDPKFNHDYTASYEYQGGIGLPPLWRFVSAISQSADDHEVRTRIRGVFNEAEQYVINYYEDRVYNGHIPSECLERTNRSAIFSTSKLQEYLKTVDHHPVLINHELTSLLLHLIVFDEFAGQRSLLPKEFQCHSVLRNAFANTKTSPPHEIKDKEAALSAHRVLAAYIRPNVERNSIYLEERHELIESVAATFERNFSHWSKGDRRKRRESMRRLLAMTADLGVFLFSQPSTFVFNWGVLNNTMKLSKVPIWPSVIRSINDEGVAVERPDVLIKQKEADLSVYLTSGRQNFLHLENGVSSIARDSSVSSEDETDEHGMRQATDPYNVRDEDTASFATAQVLSKNRRTQNTDQRNLTQNLTDPLDGLSAENLSLTPYSKSKFNDSSTDYYESVTSPPTKTTTRKDIVARRPLNQNSTITAGDHESFNPQHLKGASSQAVSHNHEIEYNDRQQTSTGRQDRQQAQTPSYVKPTYQALNDNVTQPSQPPQQLRRSSKSAEPHPPQQSPTRGLRHTYDQQRQQPSSARIKEEDRGRNHPQPEESRSNPARSMTWDYAGNLQQNNSSRAFF